jgi:hypothetical protein
MYEFQVSIHALPDDCMRGQPVELPGGRFTPLALAPERLGSITLPRTFEEVAADLARLERLFIEPDGSFVWVSSRQDAPWQVDGMIYDHQDRVRFVDLKGVCPADQFDRLLTVLGWPQTRLMFQLTHQAILLDESEFRRYALRPTTS